MVRIGLEKTAFTSEKVCINDLLSTSGQLPDESVDDGKSLWP
jgi:hypothetical protein